MANTLSIIVDAVWKGSQAFQKAQADVKKLERDAKGGAGGVGMSFKSVALGVGVATAALGTMAVVARQVWQTLGQGGELQLTEDRFYKLAESINSTGDALLGKLKDATRGMMSDAALMASATDMISLGLAKTEDQAVRLVTVVGTMGWDMQQVILTFANNSKMRLDALGLSVEEVTRRQQELAASGMSLDEAFDLAVIEAGEAKMGIMAATTGSATISIKQFTAALQDANNEFKQTYAEELAGDLGDMASGAQALGDNLEYAAAGAAKLAATLTSGPLESIAKIGASAELDKLVQDFVRLGGVIDETFAVEHFAAFSTPAVASYDQIAAAVAAMRQEIVGLETAAAATNPELNDMAVAAIMLRTAADSGGASALDYATDITIWGNSAKDAREAALALGEAWANMTTPVQRGATTVQGMTNRLALWAQTTNQRNRAADESRAAMMEEEQAAYSLGGAVAHVITMEEALAAAHGRLASAFSAEVMAKPEEGLIDAAGVVNMENANKALYEQAQAAGATAAQLAMLGVATGQFTEEQAQAALKAAILQERIKQIAAGVASGELSYSDAAGGLASFGEALNAGALGEVAGGIEGVAQAATDFASGTYEAELSVEDAAARTAILDIIELIGQASGTFYTNFVVTTTNDGTPSTDAPGRIGVQRNAYTVDTRQSGFVGGGGATRMLEWQGDGGGSGAADNRTAYNVTVNNYIDGQKTSNRQLEDITTDKLRAALNSLGVRR